MTGIDKLSIIPPRLKRLSTVMVSAEPARAEAPHRYPLSGRSPARPPPDPRSAYLPVYRLASSLSIILKYDSWRR